MDEITRAYEGVHSGETPGQREDVGQLRRGHRKLHMSPTAKVQTAKVEE